MPEEDWSRLAGFVGARIAELNVTQAQIQERGGPSPAKVREITSRRATALSPSKRRDLERALRWASGSVDAVLAGGDPITDNPKADGANTTEPEPPAVLPDEMGFDTLVLVAKTLMTVPWLTTDEHQRMTEAIHDAKRGAELLRPMLHVPEVQTAYAKNARQLAALITELGQLLADRGPQEHKENL